MWGMDDVFVDLGTEVASSNWYDPITDVANSAWDWLKTDTGSAFVFGAAHGAMGYLAQKDQQQYEKDMYNRRLDDADERYTASSVGDSYNSHNTSLTGGMLTQGSLLK